MSGTHNLSLVALEDGTANWDIVKKGAAAKDTSGSSMARVFASSRS